MKFINGKSLFIFGFLINLYLIVLFFGNESHGFPLMFFSSDCFYLPSLYRDLIVDHNSLNGWQLNPSPNFFPEWPVYFLFNYLSGDVRTASFLFALFNFFGISLLIVMVYKTAFQGISWLYLAYVNFALSSFLLVYLVNGEYILSGLIFLSAFHNGVFIMSLTCMWLFLVFLNKGKNYWIPGILFLLSFLTTVSDRLFLVFFTLPLLSTLVLWKERSLRPKLILTICWSAAGTIAGFLVFSILERSQALSFTNVSGRIFNFEKIPDSFSFFASQMWSYVTQGGFKATIILISTAALVVAIVLSIRIIFSRKCFLPLQAKVAIILLTSFIMLVLLNPVINGTYFAVVLIRYNIHALYVAITLPAVFFYCLLQNRKLVRSVLLITAIIITISQLVYAFSFQSPKQAHINFSKALDYYPERIAKMDALVDVYNLRNGISEYQFAKQTTFLSKKNLTVRHVYPNLSIYNHVSNRKWYIGEPDSSGVPSPLFNFLIVGETLDSLSIRQVFGQNIDTIYRGKPMILKVPDFYFSSSTQMPVIK
jgi:hypothetical protein